MMEVDWLIIFKTESNKLNTVVERQEFVTSMGRLIRSDPTVFLIGFLLIDWLTDWLIDHWNSFTE